MKTLPESVRLLFDEVESFVVTASLANDSFNPDRFSCWMALGLVGPWVEDEMRRVLRLAGEASAFIDLGSLMIDEPSYYNRCCQLEGGFSNISYWEYINDRRRINRPFTCLYNTYIASKAWKEYETTG